MTPSLVMFGDADALRGHLDSLNEDGQSPVAVGWTAPPYTQPFLITLVGPYVESEDVLFDSPWQRDVDYGRRKDDGSWEPMKPRCEDCFGVVHVISDLCFPVTVLADKTYRRCAECNFSMPGEPDPAWLCVDCGPSQEQLMAASEQAARRAATSAPQDPS